MAFKLFELTQIIRQHYMNSKMTDKVSQFSQTVLIACFGAALMGFSLALMQKQVNKQERQFCKTSATARMLISTRSTVGTVVTCVPTPSNF